MKRSLRVINKCAAMRAAKERKRLDGPAREPYIADDRVETLTYCGLGQMRRIVFRRDGKGRLTLPSGNVITATLLSVQLRKWMAVKPRSME